jgi:hypothetical protein
VVVVVVAMVVVVVVVPMVMVCEKQLDPFQMKLLAVVSVAMNQFICDLCNKVVLQMVE